MSDVLHVASTALVRPNLSALGLASRSAHDGAERDGLRRPGGAPARHPRGGLATAALVVTTAAIVGLGTANLVQHYQLAVVGSLGLSTARAIPSQRFTTREASDQRP